jgi:hypothetical protein
MIYALLILCIALAGISGFLLAYLAFIEMSRRQLQQRLMELEKEFHALMSKPAIRPMKPQPPSSETETWPEFVDNERLR